MIKHLLKKGYRGVSILSSKGEWDYFATLLSLDYPKDCIKMRDGILLKKLGLKIPKGEFVFMIKAYATLVILRELASVKFEIVDNQAIANTREIKIEIQTAEEIFILNEVFVKGAYNFLTPNTVSKKVVIDIGLNVGIASLFFASNPDVSAVYSFEPFIPTFHQAEKNLTLNDRLSKKVKIRNYGLGNKSEVMEVEYSLEHKGRNGIWGTKLVHDIDKIIRKEQIQIKAANEEITKIIRSHEEDTVFIVKVDCEGSEYEIFDSLNNMNKGLLKKVNLFMVEWHEKGVNDLIDFFRENEYTTLSFDSHNQKAGMIYGFR